MQSGEYGGSRLSRDFKLRAPVGISAMYFELLRCTAPPDRDTMHTFEVSCWRRGRMPGGGGASLWYSAGAEG